jgi:hypothetical protein
MTLLRTETITDADFLDKQTYQLADGSTVPSQRLVIRALKIGDRLWGMWLAAQLLSQVVCFSDKVSSVASNHGRSTIRGVR